MVCVCSQAPQVTDNLALSDIGILLDSVGEPLDLFQNLGNLRKAQIGHDIISYGRIVHNIPLTRRTVDDGNLKKPTLSTIGCVRITQNTGTVSIGKVEYFVVAVRVIHVRIVPNPMQDCKRDSWKSFLCCKCL